MDLLEGWDIPAVLLAALEADDFRVPTVLQASVWSAGRGDYQADLLVHVRFVFEKAVRLCGNINCFFVRNPWGGRTQQVADFKMVVSLRFFFFKSLLARGFTRCLCCFSHLFCLFSCCRSCLLALHPYLFVFFRFFFSFYFRGCRETKRPQPTRL